MDSCSYIWMSSSFRRRVSYLSSLAKRDEHYLYFPSEKEIGVLCSSTHFDMNIVDNETLTEPHPLGGLFLESK